MNGLVHAPAARLRRPGARALQRLPRAVPARCAPRTTCRSCVPTTPAQYFHVLRRQIHRTFRKPLDPDDAQEPAARSEPSFSTLEEFTDAAVPDRASTTRPTPKRDSVPPGALLQRQGLLHLAAAREKEGVKDVAIVRVEQLYPFPQQGAAGDPGQVPPGAGSLLGAGGAEEPRRVDTSSSRACASMLPGPGGARTTSAATKPPAPRPAPTMHEIEERGAGRAALDAQPPATTAAAASRPSAGPAARRRASQSRPGRRRRHAAATAPATASRRRRVGLSCQLTPRRVSLRRDRLASN